MLRKDIQVKVIAKCHACRGVGFVDKPIGTVVRVLIVSQGCNACNKLGLTVVGISRWLMNNLDWDKFNIVEEIDIETSEVRQYHY